jgi:hypothetical protein
MVDVLLILAAAASRYAQGNGYGGIGRWTLLPVLLACGYFGPLDCQLSVGPELWSVVGLVLAGWATIAAGYTEWGNWQYGLVRYTLPVAIVAATAHQFTGNNSFIAYILIGPVLTAIYYFVAEHKPVWLSNIVGNRDVAAALAGATVGCLVLLP